MSSDSRPLDIVATLARCEVCDLVQKVPSEDWTEHVGLIYDSYDMTVTYPAPRLTYETAGSQSVRVDKFAKFIGLDLPARTEIRLLDIGTGNGDLLRSLSHLIPGIRMDAVETSARHRGEIIKIKGVENFFSEMDDLVGEYDVIVLSHVLEHVVDPSSFLNQVRGLLTHDGILAIQVPYYIMNCLDLVVYDHCSHFDMGTLEKVLRSAGLSILRVELTNGEREISCLARMSSEEAKSSTVSLSRIALPGCIRVLQSFRKGLKAIRDVEHYVLGAGNGGAWVYGQTRGDVTGFIEDDSLRIGTQFLGRPVVGRDAVVEEGALSLPVFGGRAESILASFPKIPKILVAPQQEFEFHQ